MCKHEWKLNGWTSIKCKHCDYLERDEKKVDEFITAFFKARVIEDHPHLNSEAWNKVLHKRGYHV